MERKFYLQCFFHVFYEMINYSHIFCFPIWTFMVIMVCAGVGARQSALLRDEEKKPYCDHVRGRRAFTAFTAFYCMSYSYFSIAAHVLFIFCKALIRECGTNGEFSAREARGFGWGN